MQSVISVRNLTKEYKRKKIGITIPGVNKEGIENSTIALNSVDMDVYEGEFLVIMGPSGAGKSTLLNMISTIDRGSKGSVKIFDKVISKLSEEEISKFRYEELGFIFQNFNVLNNLTVKENIILPLALKNDSIDKITEKLDKISKELQISELLHKYPNECSGGQVQRIAACRALINNPKIIIADEPTGNLDSKTSHNLLELLKKMNIEENKTIVMVTHDPTIASYGDRLLYIKDGKIEKEIKRLNKSQKNYFFSILEVVSKESMNLFDD